MGFAERWKSCGSRPGRVNVNTTDPAAHPSQAAEPDGATDEIPQQMTDALLAGEDAALRGGEGT